MCFFLLFLFYTFQNPQSLGFFSVFAKLVLNISKLISHIIFPIINTNKTFAYCFSFIRGWESSFFNKIPITKAHKIAIIILYITD